MNILVPIGAAAAILLGGIMISTAGWHVPPVETIQSGYRGTAMDNVKDADAVAALKAANVVPESLVASDTTGPKVKDLPDNYKNVQVLGDLTEDQFNTLMANISSWVAPQEGENASCAYCHNINNMAEDSLYTKVVARRMLQMTRAINSQWKTHVAATGVTCYTCHRGQPVPTAVWFKEPGDPVGAPGWVGWRNGQNIVSKTAGSTSLPYNSLADYLLGDRKIRVHTLTALPSGNKASIQDTESTHALMIYMSESLGVNCTTCHNSRAFNDWDQSPPQRVTAWHGIRMARDLNNNYLEPLTGVFPPNRLGKLGDVAKIGCATCHKGVNKPLYGVSMLKDYLPELGGPQDPP